MACVLSDDIAVVNNAAAEKGEQSGDSASVQREEPFRYGRLPPEGQGSGLRQAGVKRFPRFAPFRFGLSRTSSLRKRCRQAPDLAIATVPKCEALSQNAPIRS